MILTQDVSWLSLHKFSDDKIFPIKKVFLLWFLTFTIKDLKKFSKTLFPPKDQIFPKKSNSGNYKNVGTVIKSNPFFVQK